MDDVRDVLINLVAAAIGVFVGWAVRGLKQWWQQRPIRRFWGPTASRGLTIVFAAQDRDATKRWEQSGLVGMGDVVGLLAVQRELQTIGCQVRVAPVDTLSPGDRESDLLLLGGPDANRLTADVMERYSLQLSVAVPGWRSHIVSLYDSQTGATFSPRQDVDRAVSVDYGLVTRLPNPFANGRKTEILILAGCWGYGTAGAVEAVCDPEFLKRVAVAKGRYFEAVVETSVHANTAHYVRPKLVRPIALSD